MKRFKVFDESEMTTTSNWWDTKEIVDALDTEMSKRELRSISDFCQQIKLNIEWAAGWVSTEEKKDHEYIALHLATDPGDEWDMCDVALYSAKDLARELGRSVISDKEQFSAVNADCSRNNEDIDRGITRIDEGISFFENVIKELSQIKHEVLS